VGNVFGLYRQGTPENGQELVKKNLTAPVLDGNIEYMSVVSSPDLSVKQA